MLGVFLGSQMSVLVLFLLADMFIVSEAGAAGSAPAGKVRVPVTSKLSTINYFAEAWTVNPLVILSGGKDALLARETFVTDLCIYIYIYI